MNFYNNKGFDNNNFESNGQAHYAVEVNRVHFSYGKWRVLNGIDMHVPHNSIYALLGASGCGKTTLLRCVVGRLQTQIGVVKVFGRSPGSPESRIPGDGVGFMPQEIALFGGFSINETFDYYGKLLSLDLGKMRERALQLVKILELPDVSRLVGSLSGGQKRRVSLTIALLHRPPLLILDEPTVGVDPLLRETIWNYLTAMVCHERVTVIITTHYIEEASAADCVGMMRGGKLLAEANPAQLRSELAMNSLEAVFIELSRKDEENDANAAHDKNHTNRSLLDVYFDLPPKIVNTPAPAADDAGGGMRARMGPLRASLIRTRAITWKNLIQTRRNRVFLSLQFLFPALNMLLMSRALGQDPYDLPVAVVSDDKLRFMSEKIVGHMSNVTFDLRVASDVDDALEGIENGTFAAVVHFPASYSKDVIAYGSRVLNWDEDDRDPVIIPKFWLYLDPSDYVTSQTIQKELLDAINMTSFDLRDSEVFGACKNSFDGPYQLNAVFGNKKQTLQSTIVPGFMAADTFGVALALTSITLVIEAREYLLERALVAGTKPFEIIVAAVVGQLLTVSGQVLFSTLVAAYVLNLGVVGSIAVVYIILWLQGVLGVSYGLFLSAFCTNETQAMLLALSSYILVIALGGCTWPVEAMPKFLRYASYVSPLTIPTKGLRLVMYRDWDFTHPFIALGVLVSGTLIFLLIFSASLLFKKRI